jgi:hypothetical protein
MAKSYAERLQEERRLVILRLLYELPGQKANSSSLYHALDDYGIHAARADVRAELAWLAHRELVSIEDITPASSDSPLLLATITDAGRDVVRGKTQVLGVQRPGR